MRPLNVKSTIVDELLNWLAPHYCSYCCDIGSLLCEGCKYDIVSEKIDACLLCGRLSTANGVCLARCSPAIERSWCAGEFSDGMERLIGAYKFNYAKAAYRPLGEVLLACLPQLPSDTVIVPIPTVRRHVRQRGYDHTMLLAQYIADKLSLRVDNLLVRATSDVQKGANRQQRQLQAKVAFGLSASPQPDIPYLLIDDVVSTGFTMKYAARALSEAGSKKVWAGAVARNP